MDIAIKRFFDASDCARLVVDSTGDITIYFPGLAEPFSVLEFDPNSPTRKALEVVMEAGPDPGDYLRPVPVLKK